MIESQSTITIYPRTDLFTHEFFFFFLLGPYFLWGCWLHDQCTNSKLSLHNSCYPASSGFSRPDTTLEAYIPTYCSVWPGETTAGRVCCWEPVILVYLLTGSIGLYTCFHFLNSGFSCHGEIDWEVHVTSKPSLGQYCERSNKGKQFSMCWENLVTFQSQNLFMKSHTHLHLLFPIHHLNKKRG